MQARCLRRGEEKKWYDLIGEECRGFFTQSTNYPPESHLIIEENDRFIGGMEIIIDEPDVAILLNPTIKTKDSLGAIEQLVSNGLNTAKSLNVQKILSLIHDSNDQLESIQKILADFEFKLELKKGLYSREPIPIAYGNSNLQLNYKSLTDIGEELFIGLFGRVYQPDVFETNSEKCFYGLKRGAVHTNRFYSGDWELAYLGEKAVGLTMPQVHDEQGEYGSNFYLGVTLEARVKGIGLALQRRAVDTLVKRGARMILGSTDVKNIPMIRIFESLGYEFEEYQYFYKFKEDK